ncbi:pyrokinin-1 receptor-like isoform X1 [Trichogramma pretiosum]|uniref:pyrokinin-1 receptor-like isoform X1 n=1 Tax=Trichogramma pretiosum TaxID=7493 RepID=UPI0006C9BA5F|nr:pyrokinin-1 receptor-like isoform X1 [Trichogramma pretiosum]
MENLYDIYNVTSSKLLPNATTTLSATRHEDELKDHLIAVRDPLFIVIPISIIYASIFITGTIGNISTCIVIARNKSMHTATNYYLFSLAISDLLLLFCGLPVEIYVVWFKYPYVFGEAFCVLRGVAAETSTNASVLTITAFTAERYVAICHPFLSHTMSKLSRAIKLILVIWLIALAFAVPLALPFGLVQYSPRPEDVLCQFKGEIFKHSFELSTLLFFIVPMTLIMVLYVLIGLKLKKSTILTKVNRHQQQHHHKRSDVTGKKTSRSRVDRNCRHSRSTRRVLKMLVAVVVAFFICWAPFHMQRLIATYGKKEHFEDYSKESSIKIQMLYAIFTYVSGVFYYISTTINPILYNIMSHKFREAFMETLAKSCRMTGFIKPRERRSYSSLSRSQQRIPTSGPSKTTHESGVTGLGHARTSESTDCSGNSSRDGGQDVGSDYFAATCDTPATQPLTIQVGAPPVSTEAAANNNKFPVNSSYDSKSTSNEATNLPMTSFGPIGGVEQNQQQQQQRRQQLDFARFDTSTSADLMLSMPNADDKVIAAAQQQQQGFSPTRLHRSINNAINGKNNGHGSKKWWRLLDWLPGIKSLRNSRTLGLASNGATATLSSQENSVILDPNQRSVIVKQHQDSAEYFVPLHTFKSSNNKDSTCKPV